MSDPSSWIASDYADYLRLFERVKGDGALPPWYDPLDFDAWLSRQTMAYLRGQGAPRNPID